MTTYIYLFVEDKPIDTEHTFTVNEDYFDLFGISSQKYNITLWVSLRMGRLIAGYIHNNQKFQIMSGKVDYEIDRKINALILEIDTEHLNDKTYDILGHALVFEMISLFQGYFCCPGGLESMEEFTSSTTEPWRRYHHFAIYSRNFQEKVVDYIISHAKREGGMFRYAYRQPYLLTENSIGFGDENLARHTAAYPGGLRVSYTDRTVYLHLIMVDFQHAELLEEALRTE